MLHIEPEVQDIAVLDDIFLPLQPELARIARACFAIASDVVVIGDGLRADEAFLEIGMNDAGGLRRARTFTTVQARASIGPAVKKVMRPKSA